MIEAEVGAEAEGAPGPEIAIAGGAVIEILVAVGEGQLRLLTRPACRWIYIFGEMWDVQHAGTHASGIWGLDSLAWVKNLVLLCTVLELTSMTGILLRMLVGIRQYSLHHLIPKCSAGCRGPPAAARDPTAAADSHAAIPPRPADGAHKYSGCHDGAGGGGRGGGCGRRCHGAAQPGHEEGS